jgi:hypothetical protein
MSSGNFPCSAEGEVIGDGCGDVIACGAGEDVAACGNGVPGAGPSLWPKDASATRQKSNPIAIALNGFKFIALLSWKCGCLYSL